jgi:hypothetical protein
MHQGRIKIENEKKIRISMFKILKNSLRIDRRAIQHFWIIILIDRIMIKPLSSPYYN